MMPSAAPPRQEYLERQRNQNAFVPRICAAPEQQQQVSRDVDQEELRYSDTRYHDRTMSEPSSLSCKERCFCVAVKPRSSLAQWMLLDDHSTKPQSLAQKLLCHCKPEKRVNSGVGDVPQIASLAGATLQRGSYSPTWDTDICPSIHRVFSLQEHSADDLAT